MIFRSLFNEEGRGVERFYFIVVNTMQVENITHFRNKEISGKMQKGASVTESVITSRYLNKSEFITEFAYYQNKINILIVLVIPYGHKGS